MRFTHIYIPTGEYVDDQGRKAKIVREDTPGVEAGRGIHRIGSTIQQRLTKPWIRSQSEFDYAIDAGLSPIIGSRVLAPRSVVVKAERRGVIPSTAGTAPRQTRG